MNIRAMVQEILTRRGLPNKFSVRTIDFTDLARADVHLVTIKDWTLWAETKHIRAEIYAALNTPGEFKAVTVEFEANAQKGKVN